MGHHFPDVGSDTSKFSEEGSDSIIQINVMTTDTRIHSFTVNRNIQVSSLKETIADSINVPVEHQRLIFNGSILEDNHFLSDYHLDNGYVIHLIGRQADSLQQSSHVSSGQANRRAGTQDHDAESDGNAYPSLYEHQPENALITLSTFMRTMEDIHSQNGYIPSTSSDVWESMPVVDLPTNRLGFPTPAALRSILQLTQNILSGHTVASLSQFPRRLDQSSTSSDPAVREQIQEEALRAGHAIQHLGSLFLELGSVVSTLHVSRTPTLSSVYCGPAVYITPHGPRPLTVQVGNERYSYTPGGVVLNTEDDIPPQGDANANSSSGDDSANPSGNDDDNSADLISL